MNTGTLDASECVRIYIESNQNERLLWKYRGQVVPQNRVVTAEIDMVSVEEERASGAVTLRADGALWVDGTKIYAVRGLALRIVDDG